MDKSEVHLQRDEGSRTFLAMVAALAMTMLASVALFVLLQYWFAYTHYIHRGTDRAFGAPGKMRAAVWPALVCVLLQAGGGYAVSRLSKFGGWRRWGFGVGISVAMTLVFVAAIWLAVKR